MRALSFALLFTLSLGGVAACTSPPSEALPGDGPPLYLGSFALTLDAPQRYSCSEFRGVERDGQVADLVADVSGAHAVDGRLTFQARLPAGLLVFDGTLTCEDLETHAAVTLHSLPATVDVTGSGWTLPFDFVLPEGTAPEGDVALRFCHGASITSVVPTTLCPGDPIQLTVAVGSEPANSACVLDVVASLDGQEAVAPSVTVGAAPLTLALTAPAAPGDYPLSLEVRNATGALEVDAADVVVSTCDGVVPEPTVCALPALDPVELGCPAAPDATTLTARVGVTLEGVRFGNLRFALTAAPAGVDFAAATAGQPLLDAEIVDGDGFDYALPQAGVLTTVFLPKDAVAPVPIAPGEWLEVELAASGGLVAGDQVTVHVTGTLSQRVIDADPYTQVPVDFTTTLVVE